MDMYKKMSFVMVWLLLLCHSISLAQPAVWVSEPQFTSFEPLGFGYFKVKKGGLYGVLDQDGNRIIDCNYSEICPFSGECSVLLKNGRIMAILNSKGDVSKINDELYPDDNYPYFSEGLLAVRNKSDEWGYIDKRGTVVIDLNFKMANPFSCGKAAVVLNRNGRNCHMHINTAGEKTRIGAGFDGYDFFFFASSYVDDEQRGAFAMVCIDYYLYKIDLNGNRIPGFKMRLNSDPTKNPKREIEVSGQTVVRFDKAWRPVMIKQRGQEENYPEALLESLDRISHLETNIESIHSIDGYSVCINGKQPLRNKWDKIIPMGKNLCAVLQSGVYGIIRIDSNPSSMIQASVHPIVLNHCCPFNIEGELSRDFEPDFELYARLDGSEQFQKVRVSDRHFTIPGVTLKSLEGVTSMNVEFYCNTRGLEYDLETQKIDIVFRPGFKVSIPINGNQDDSGNVNISITLSNISVSDSGPVKVLINDSVVKSFTTIAAGQSVNCPVSMAIDMGLEDFKTLRITVRVNEMGCKSIISVEDVKIQRYYSN